MVTLDKEDIVFIENYLEHSDILYADIRMEMTDHVASEIEVLMSAQNSNFYDTFKRYMITNKATLLDANKQFIKAADQAILKKLWVALIRIPTLLLSCTLVFLVHKVLLSLEVDALQDVISSLPILSMVSFCIIYGLALKIYKLPRFSGVERLGFLYVISFQIINIMSTFPKFFVQSKNDLLMVSVIFALLITVNVLVLKITFQTIQEYRHGYKSIIS